jgi:hypothetical protein
VAALRWQMLSPVFTCTSPKESKRTDHHLNTSSASSSINADMTDEHKEYKALSQRSNIRGKRGLRHAAAVDELAADAGVPEQQQLQQQCGQSLNSKQSSVASNGILKSRSSSSSN